MYIERFDIEKNPLIEEFEEMNSIRNDWINQLCSAGYDPAEFNVIVTRKEKK